MYGSSFNRPGGMRIVTGFPITSAAVSPHRLSAPPLVPARNDPVQVLADDGVVGRFDDRRHLSHYCFGLLAVGDLHHYVDRPKQFPRLIVEWVDMSQDGQPRAVRALDHDFVPLVYLIPLNRERHPTLTVGNLRALRRIKPV